MGFWGTVSGRVRSLLQWDKEKVVLQLAKGGTASTYPQTGFDLLQAYGYDVLSDYLKLEHDLMARFVDYEEMDDYPELASAIDIYADDATQNESLQNRTVWCDSQDKTIETIITDLMERRLRIDEEIWSMARTLVKYGNDYEELLVANDGVVGLNFLPPPTMRRIEGRRGELFGFIQDFKGRFGYSPDEFKQILAQRTAYGETGQGWEKMAALEDWEVVHMRMRSKHRRSIYGHSVLEPARWIWKRLMLLEDAAMVYRLQRAPERYAFYVDVGDLPPKEAFAYLNKVRQQYKKTKFYNPSTGKLDLKFNPLSQDEDFFLPIRKGVQGTRIDVLGSPSWQHMDDIEYFRLKLFAAIKVPKTYLGFAESTGKGVLSQEDVRFARTVLRLQRELRNGLSKVARVHLAALNINPAAVDYNIYMTVPSSIFELAQLEVRNAKADFAGRMSQFVSLHWILQKIFGLSDHEIEYIIKQRHEEMLADAEIQAKAGGMQLQVQGAVQAQQQAQMAGMGPLQNAMTAKPGTVQAEEARAYMREAGSLSRMWPLKRQLAGYQPITEKDLMAGNRDHEKRMEDNMEKVLKSNRGMANRLGELGELVHELRHSMPRNGYSNNR
jgi:hypothetical protein